MIFQPDAIWFSGGKQFKSSIVVAWLRGVKKEIFFSAVAREQTIGEWKQNGATTAIHVLPACVCYCFRLCVWSCVCFNLYLVIAIIAFSCNWHIECLCVSLRVCFVWLFSCNFNCRKKCARENNSRFAARAVGWVSAGTRESAREREQSRREYAKEISVSLWLLGLSLRSRFFSCYCLMLIIVLSDALRRVRTRSCLNR